MGMMAGIIGGVGALSGLFGGSGTAQNVPLPPQFNMPNMGAAANNAFSGIQGLKPFSDASFSTIPNAQQAFGTAFNNPGAGAMIGGANPAMSMGTTAATNAFAGGTGLENAGFNMMPYATSILNTGFDPQTSLYNRTVQQLTDQTRAGLEARGMDNTPYGAGVEGQTLGNFNIDWQNNLLNRQSTAAGAAGNLASSGANIFNLGAGISNAAPGQFFNSAAIPYTAFNTMAGGQNQALSQLLTLLGSGQNVANLPVSDWLSYAQTGNQAGGVANQQASLALQQQNQGFNQNQVLGAALGRSLYGIGGANATNSPFFNSMIPTQFG